MLIACFQAGIPADVSDVNAVAMQVMTVVFALILLPFIAGVALLALRDNRLRGGLVAVITLLVCGGVAVLALTPVPVDFAGAPLSSAGLKAGLLLAEIGMAAYVLYVGLRTRSALVIGLIAAQSALVAWLEFTGPEPAGPQHPLFIDKFAVIMALINGLVGGGICLYALGYMREYHEVTHREVRDRRPLFFALLFVFMGAMFGLVFANNLKWLFLFWEITTLCSFLLIGYTQTEEAQRNALRALIMNLAGGVAFAAAIVWCHRQVGNIELQALLGSKHSLALLPAALLCFAGITKSAQLPFSSWLLGAMVAPTPVSALLHSSTMVKAGVYLVLRMAPIVTGTTVGLLVALVGGVTFLIASLAAITTSDAKRVLAHSTIANLGLIVLCGGIGTYSAVWAGVLLIIFHALAKCLLFLCVGVVEHRLHSRDIEAMSGLVIQWPRLAVMMQIGMAGMFLAPFGMLISKWAVLKAVVDASPPLSVLVAFGSAATLFFWVKWMGKLIQVIEPDQHLPQALAPGEAITLYGLSAATFSACLFFPWLSSLLIEPYVVQVYGRSASMGQGNVLLMMLMMAMVLLFPLSFLNYGRGVRVTNAYLGGANAQSSVRFVGSAEQVQEVAIGNYYLRGFINEPWLSRWGVIGCTALLAAMVVASFV
jgi:ech hydrogenase subunit A